MSIGLENFVGRLCQSRKHSGSTETPYKNCYIALKVEKYRERLRVNDEVKLVFLHGSYAVIAEQLRHRRGHFFDRALLKSQFDDLKEPLPDEGALTIELGRPPQELVKEIKEKLHLSRG